MSSNREKPYLSAGEIYDGDGGREFNNDAAQVRASVRKAARSLGVVLQPDAIEDLVQETFLRIVARRSGGEIACMPAYLARVARNTTIEWLKWRSAQKRDARLTTSLSEVSTMVSAAPNPEEEAAWRDVLAHRLARQEASKPERVCRE